MATGQDFPVIEGFPEDYRAGHFAVIGASQSGKTYYTKYVLANLLPELPRLPDGRPPAYVYVGAISAHDWRDPEACGQPLLPAENVFTEWSEDSRAKPLLEIEGVRRGLIIIDDFKGEVDYHHDENFKRMFRVFRHMGAQVIAIAHTPNDLPPVTRDNVCHVILCATSNVEMIRKLAETYLAGDATALRRAFAQLREHAVVKLNLRANTRAIHAAPPPDQTGVSTSPIGMAVGTAAEGPVSLGAATIGMRHTTVDGVYNDASHNTQNVQLNTDIRASIRQNRVNLMAVRERTELGRALEVEGVGHASRMKHLQRCEELKELLLRPWLGAEDRDKAADLLAIELGDPSVTPYNMYADGKDVAFMTARYPSYGYAPRSRETAVVTTYGPLVTAVTRGDRGALAGEALKAGGPRLLGRAVAWLGLADPALSRAEPTPGQAARERARRLIVFRPRRAERWFSAGQQKADLVAALRLTRTRPETVTPDNVIHIALEMLKKYYPADYADEMKFIRSRALAQA